MSTVTFYHQGVKVKIVHGSNGAKDIWMIKGEGIMFHSFEHASAYAKHLIERGRSK